MTSSGSSVRRNKGARYPVPRSKKERKKERKKKMKQIGDYVRVKMNYITIFDDQYAGKINEGEGNMCNMNYAIFDKKKILSRKSGKLREESRNLEEESRKNDPIPVVYTDHGQERRRFVIKKKDIENIKRNNYVMIKYKNMMMRRKKYDMCNEKEKEAGMSKEFNKIR